MDVLDREHRPAPPAAARGATGHGQAERRSPRSAGRRRRSRQRGPRTSRRVRGQVHATCTRTAPSAARHASFTTTRRPSPRTARAGCARRATPGRLAASRNAALAATSASRQVAPQTVTCSHRRGPERRCADRSDGAAQRRRGASAAGRCRSWRCRRRLSRRRLRPAAPRRRRRARRYHRRQTPSPAFQLPERVIYGMRLDDAVQVEATPALACAGSVPAARHRASAAAAPGAWHLASARCRRSRSHSRRLEAPPSVGSTRPPVSCAAHSAVHNAAKGRDTIVSGPRPRSRRTVRSPAGSG